MAFEFFNNYASALASAAGSGATSLTLIPGGGAPLTGISGATPVQLTLVSQSNPNTFEIVQCTAVVGDVLTVTRAQEGTTALSWNPGDIVACFITRAGLAQFVSGAYVVTFVGRSGAVVALAADYAAFYPELSGNNTYTGTNTFDNNVSVQNTKTFGTANIQDAGSTGAVKLYFNNGGSAVAETISGGFQVDGNLNVSGTINITSSLRYKEDVHRLTVDAARFLTLEPITYRKKGTGQLDVGVSAEQLHGIAPELVRLDDQGRPDAVNYQGLIPYLLAIVQEQQRRLDELEDLVLPVRH